MLDRIKRFIVGAPGRTKRLIIGEPRDVEEPGVFHRISLIAFLAWVGLGADGLTSSAYGPDEAYRALGGHRELALFLVVAVALTVFVISYAYSRTIEHFPAGGGGYAVASKLLWAPIGAVSGSALVVDYVLTISVSIASGADQVFSFLPMSWHSGQLFQYTVNYKVTVEIAIVLVLVVMNLRGVKESIKVLLPMFLVFAACHLVLIGGIFTAHGARVPEVMAETSAGLQSGLQTLGLAGMLMILARAYAQGAGTYTGIEAVANGVPLMREPKVPTAKRTMVYMAVSLAVTAGGILFGYLILDVHVEEGKTLNAVLLNNLGFGDWFTVLTLLSEAALLCVAAQTGFIDGPRVMSNMAMDSWMPHRLSSLSERLTLRHGVLLMGVAALATLWYTGGDIGLLVIMYSINVFITFSLTQLGMVRLCVRDWANRASRRALPIHLVGLLLCVGVLTLVVYEKFWLGGWVTLAITSVLIGLCFLIRFYYGRVRQKFDELARQLERIPDEPGAATAKTTLDPEQPVAALLVSQYGGLGLHSVLALQKLFPNYYKQILFISVAGNPAMSVPCAFSASGLPIGIQIVGRHHDDWGVLQLGYAFEQATNIGKRRPAII